MTKKNKDAIRKHGKQLQAIFPATRDKDPINLVAGLQILENKAHKLAEDQCNRPLPEGYVEEQKDGIKIALDAILGYRAAGVPVFLNGDPRGYAIKIEDGYVREHKLSIYTDWGGYGIICPEF